MLRQTRYWFQHVAITRSDLRIRAKYSVKFTSMLKQMTAPPRFEQNISRAFVAALLLTGNLADAESAVCVAIDSMRSEGSIDDLFRLALAAAVKPRDACRTELADGRPAKSGLPLALERVLTLRVDRRQCFVLRILARVSGKECAELLKMSSARVDELACLGAQDLARIAVPEGD